MAEALLVPAGEEPGAGGRTDGAGDVTVGEAHAGGGDGIDVRRADVFGLVLAAHVGVAEVVGEED